MRGLLLDGDLVAKYLLELEQVALLKVARRGHKLLGPRVNRAGDPMWIGAAKLDSQKLAVRLECCVNGADELN